MLRTRILGIAWLALAAAGIAGAEDHAPLKFDKTRFEGYVRYAELYTAAVKIEVGDPVPSPYPGIERIPVHVSLGQQERERSYYLLPDGRIINGNVWDLSKSPFLDTLERLPTNGPAFGPETAKVTIVVFSDFQCPYCRQLATTLRSEIPKQYPNDVRVVFADFPLDAIHKWARGAAEAAHCMTDGNPPAFWAFHDWIFEHQGEITPANLHDKMLDYAKSKGMDTAKIGTCMASHVTASEVERSQKLGEELGVQETPTMFIDGRLLSGALPWETLQSVIKAELARPADIEVPSGKRAATEETAPTISK
jgi:protein-disulfide isomerase